MPLTISFMGQIISDLVKFYGTLKEKFQSENDKICSLWVKKVFEVGCTFSHKNAWLDPSSTC